VAEHLELGEGGGSGAQDGRLGDLQDQPGRVEVVSGQGSFDAAAQVAAGELAGADVDRDGHLLGPGAGLAQGQVQHAVTDSLGQSGGLGGDDGRQGGQEMSLGVAEAHQGLGANNQVAVDVHDGLEDQSNPVVA